MEGQNPSSTPKITVDTSNLSEGYSEPQSASSPSHRRQQTMNTPVQTEISEGLLSPNSPDRYIDGRTLNSRSGSFSFSDASTRVRSNSDISGVSAATSATYFSKSSLEYESTDDALRPDPGNEKDFGTSDSPFAFSPGQLNKLQNPKSLSAFKALGGLRGLETGLRTSITAGLSVDEIHLDGRVGFAEATNAGSKDSSNLDEIDLQRRETSSSQLEVKDRFEDRIRVFRDNRLPERKADGILTLIWRTYNDKILILLTIAAVVSLALGIYETVAGDSGVDWVEGVAICVAIIIVVTVGAANDFQKERQFVKLNKRKDDREVKVIRSGKSIQISVHDVTVGDVLHLEPGDAIPADGIFIAGHGVRCDESSATGESDQMKKTSGEEVWQRIQDGTATAKLDPFIISGSKVLEGVGTFLVTSVGQNSSYGKILMSLQTTNDPTPLQVKLGGLANWIGGLGSAAAGLLFFVLLIKFLAGLSSNTDNSAQKAQEFLDILIVAITVIVVAVPEGLPLAVTLALAFATTRMLKENNLVRVLRACETMGNATTICSDKTGTLTQNKMTVVASTVGAHEEFRDSAQSAEQSTTTTTMAAFTKLNSEVKDLLKTSIALNSTAFEGEEAGQPSYIGSKTEVAMLNMAKQYLGLDDLASERSNYTVKQLFPFDSDRKCMGIVLKLDNGVYRLLVKGASEIMLSFATSTISNVYSSSIEVDDLMVEHRQQIASLIVSYATNSLRTIGMLYRDFPSWPPAASTPLEEDPRMASFESLCKNMTWLGLVGIQDPLRAGVTEAVAQCQHSGVVVRMVTGDNVTTARAIAKDCGILSPTANEEDELVLEGPQFRQMTPEQLNGVLPKLRVLARSSPEDKRLLVAGLKALGETVAVTGDGTNDGPALKTADVGFSMGIAGTEVAKEASSIILLDDNFSSTITALMWGRAVNDAVKKFLQFQITVNITAVILTFVSAVSNDSNHSVLSAVQLLWVNLIMDTLAALALATDPPTRKILDRPPQSKKESLITINMWKMISLQAVYQLVVTFILYFLGMSILGYQDTDQKRTELNTVVFNSFVWMQIFNQLNNRRLDNKFNVFEGILSNYWFMGINVIMVAGQIMIIFVGGAAFQITRLDGTQWAVSILTALPCLLWAVGVRMIPDEAFGVVFNAVVGGATAILRPIVKALHVVFHPLAQLWRSGKRAVRRAVGKKPEAEVEQGGRNFDEETGYPSAPTVVSTHKPDLDLPVEQGVKENEMEQKALQQNEESVWRMEVPTLEISEARD